MKQEMRKLNRAKYARTAEEMKQLAAQGYVPVETAAADQPGEAPGRKDKKAAQTGEASGRKDKKAGQPAAVPDQEAATPEQTAADPAQAVADGGGSGT